MERLVDIGWKMLGHPLTAAVGAYCANHPNASTCSPNNIGAEIIAILIVALIVALGVFNWWWRRGNPDSIGPIMRAVLTITRRLGPRKR
jgi:hypothetical protein